MIAASLTLSFHKMLWTEETITAICPDPTGNPIPTLTS